MDITLKPSGYENSPAAEICLDGNVDENEAISLADRMLNLLPSEPPPQVIINLASCSLFCTQAIGALVTFALSPQVEGSRLLLRGLSAPLRERMQNLNLDRLFPLESPESPGSEDTPNPKHKA